MLSIRSNYSSLSSLTSMNQATDAMQKSAQRLATGFRINSAADDAAGLQIATRMQTQDLGMQQAQKNVADASSMLQVADGAFNQVLDTMGRMKTLATQAANDTNSQDDRNAINSELNSLNQQLNDIMNTTQYAGANLFATASGSAGGNVSGGKLDHNMVFQVGNTSGEAMTVNYSTQLGAMYGAKGFKGIAGATAAVSGGQINITSASGAQALMSGIDSAMSQVTQMRSALGADMNRLQATGTNLTNMDNNTQAAIGNIMDTDYGTETSNLTRNQMLAQASMMMLKQSNGMSGMVMNLLQG
ncbi:flagellin N-terminal helical domain-containing protein [Enterobacter ludwigii]|uniref:flagellin N-terminal helical domain-containing protein n=1 Tax=Enterobacter ludwigii TaxID=299767 RepID=UPI003F709C2D